MPTTSDDGESVLEAAMRASMESIKRNRPRWPNPEREIEEAEYARDWPDEDLADREADRYEKCLDRMKEHGT